MAVFAQTEQHRADGRQERQAVFWNGLLLVLLLCWSFAVLRVPFGALAPAVLWGALAAGVSILLWTAGDRSGKVWLKWLLRLLPWLAVLPFAGQLRRGMLLWMNGVLTLWNTVHQGGAALFPVEGTTQSLLVVSVAAAIALGQFFVTVVSGRHVLWCGISGIALLLLQLLTGTFSPGVWALWLSAFLGLWMSGTQKTPSSQAVRLWAVCTAIALVCALPGSETVLSGVTRLRETTVRAVEELRYGKDELPQGHLDQAASLHQGERERLRVQTGQEKTLYLRAFVGAAYADGMWTSLPSSAYGGTYAGLLKWLRSQGFDPLTQSAAYYALCDQTQAPEANPLQIQVTGGARSYLYVPISADTVSASYGEQKDVRMQPKGLLGKRSYVVSERSSAQPSELTLWEDWVANPRTEEQERYVQAEKMYRSFVYDTYARPDEQLQAMLQDLFWADYAPESDGVYAAVDRIRTVLSQRTTYQKEPEAAPEGTDAIADFLTGARQGNDVLYASAAVQALRAKGIPARYVEGYYVSADAVADSADGTVSLTGQDAHAWAEVYFDGIGWLPVDVTPGYYYDAVALRQMVALPDTVKKTASLDGGAGGGENLSMGTDNAQHLQPGKIVRNTVLLLLGLLALAVVALTLWYVGRKLMMLWAQYRRKQAYVRADNAGRTELLKTWIYGALSAAGIDACLGWRTGETDAAVAESFPAVEAGEYARVVVLLEKFGYGGVALEPFELRVLQSFLGKITDQRK